MKLQNFIVIFVIIILPVILLVSLYISTGLKTINNQSLYDTGLLKATYDAVYAFEQNTANDKYSNNPEEKRDIIKASIKMFEKSLCNNCNISLYNVNEIEKHIPAIVFGMYDGFYMYAPSAIYNTETEQTEYKHNLKNYVYYSEILEGIGCDGSDVVITYSLDNYVTVSGYFLEKGEPIYQIKSGYLELLNEYMDLIEPGTVHIDNKIADQYYSDNIDFTEWFNAQVANEKEVLTINENNDPDNPNSLFNKHKKEVIKKKLESVLNSSITAYSERSLTYNYKMPKLSEDDWEKIYNNISVITFFQGKTIGLTSYNGYCVLNSTNHKEYVNPNLMYFIDNNGYYHDIRCDECLNATKLNGYRIGSFKKQKIKQTDEAGITTTGYKYNHDELACYNCINGQLNTSQSIYEYVKQIDRNDEEKFEVKLAYYTSLATERYNSVNLLDANKTDITGEFKQYKVDEDNIVIKYIKENGNELELKVGDIVGYNPTKDGDENIKMSFFIGDTEYINNYTGNWLVLKAEEGQLVLISEYNVADLEIYGLDGFRKAEQFINGIASLYQYGKGAEKSRSVDISDFEDLTFNDTVAYYVFSRRDSKNVVQMQDYYIKEIQSFKYYNFDSELWIDIQQSNFEERFGYAIELRNKYYEEEENKPIDGILNGNYWINCRYTQLTTNPGVNYGVHIINNDKLSKQQLFEAEGEKTGGEYGVRAVVYIDDVDLVKDDTNDEWVIE